MSDAYSDRELAAQDERILNEKRRYRDPHYDVSPVRAARLDDLQVGRFMDEYLPAAVDPETLAANDRTAGERLAAAKMIVAVDDPVPTEIRRSTYPLGALQQLVGNAVMHRTYDGTNAPVHVYWFDDRIEINSPGGPYGALTPENFGRPGVIDYRNPALAEAMRVLGLVQRYGFGIPAARRELRAAGQPDPEFHVDRHWVHCTVRARAQPA